jgi:hypothetical protein
MGRLVCHECPSSLGFGSFLNRFELDVPIKNSIGHNFGRLGELGGARALLVTDLFSGLTILNELRQPFQMRDSQAQTDDSSDFSKVGGHVWNAANLDLTAKDHDLSLQSSACAQSVPEGKRAEDFKLEKFSRNFAAKHPKQKDRRYIAAFSR